MEINIQKKVHAIDKHAKEAVQKKDMALVKALLIEWNASRKIFQEIVSNDIPEEGREKRVEEKL